MLHEMHVVDNASFDPGNSSLRSNELAYSLGAHAMIQQRGIYL